MAEVSTKGGKTATKGEKVRLPLDLPDDLYQALVKRAAAEDRTLVGHLRHLIKKDTANVQLPEEAAA